MNPAAEIYPGIQRLLVLLLQPGYLVSVALQPGRHVVGQVVGVDAAALAEAQDGCGAVIVAHDDEAAVARHVEHVESAHLSCCLYGLSLLSDFAWCLCASGRFGLLA